MSRPIHSLTQLPIPLIPFLPPSFVELNLCDAKTLIPRNLRTFITLRVNSTHRAEFMLMIDLVYPTPVVVFHYIRLCDRYDTQHFLYSEAMGSAAHDSTLTLPSTRLRIVSSNICIWFLNILKSPLITSGSLSLELTQRNQLFSTVLMHEIWGEEMQM